MAVDVTVDGRVKYEINCFLSNHYSDPRAIIGLSSASSA